MRDKDYDSLVAWIATALTVLIILYAIHAAVTIRL